MPLWMMIALAGGIGVAWLVSKRSNSTPDSTGFGGGRGGMMNPFGRQSTFTPTSRFGRPSGPSADAMRDADRLHGDTQLDDRRQADFARDQEVSEERAWHHEQQQIDDDYVNSGGYY